MDIIVVIIFNGVSLLGYSQDLPQHNHQHVHDEGEAKSYSKKIKLQPQLKRLYQLDEYILDLIKQQRDVQKKIKIQQAKIENLKFSLEKLSRGMKFKRETLSRALILRKKLKSARIAEIFLNANGPMALKRREVYLDSIFKADTQKLIGLHQEQKQMREYYNTLKSLHQNIKSLQKDLNQKTQLVTQHRSDEWQILSQVYGVKPIQSQFKNRLLQLRLPPTKGRWVDQFHKFRGIERAKLWGAGIWIKSNNNAPVYSVESGRIIFAQKVKNWKYVVIIQHDHLMTSIYGAMEDITVKEGQKVVIQEFIGSVGEVNTHSQLYFELRKAGIAIHPQRWIEEK
jgi:septal ring factor EnvC (AmiA/AmiB activator)